MTELALKDVHPNVRKFLFLITKTEGTDRDGKPYNCLFGYHYFDNAFVEHPNIRIPFGKTNWSTAAGRFQILNKTAKSLKMPDFTPESQDRAAIELIRRRKALEDVTEGRFEDAINKCNKEWASLPNSPYGQPTETMVNAINFINSVKD